MKISFRDINNWDDFKVYAESMPNKKARGDAFEHLTYLYFKIDPKYSFYEWVLKKSDVPQKDLDKLKLPRKDLGIDLIAKTGEEYHPIQCKYHEDKGRSITFKEVSTFLAQLGNNKNFKMGYIASTADKTSSNYDKIETKPIQKMLSNTWFKLDKDFFDKARKFEKKKKYNPKPFFPRNYQKKAIRNAHKHFIKDNNNRGKLIFPCGAGKSLTGFFMMEELNASSTLVAVPSLMLIKQTLDVYLKEVSARNQKVKWLCICSDEGIGKKDDILYKTNEIGVPCNTDKEYINKWLQRNRNEKIIIFTTYQSGRIIADVSKSLKFKFNLGIFDEAHKTVGKNENLFSYLLFEDNISIVNRIFMTATERFYSGNFDEILTMDDPSDYGEVFSQMSFKEAIEQDILTDYKLITIKVDDKELSDFILDNNLVKITNKWGKVSEARSLASMIALRKAMEKYPIKHAVSFHSSIERAKRNMDINDVITNSYNYKPIERFHVSGKINTSKREGIINEFTSSKRSLITNSRCLTEGVDVPNIDCILFADPRKSKVDIVQAIGRALRKGDKGKKNGYVVLPVLVNEDSMEPDDQNFKDILNIVRALASNDERIIEYFRDKSKNKHKIFGAREDLLEIDPALINETKLIKNIEIKLWENLLKFDWLPFEEARRFARTLKLKSVKQWNEYSSSKKRPYNIPSNPKRIYSEEWVSYPDWMGYTRIANQDRVWWPFKEARKYARSLNLKNWDEWKAFCESDKRPIDIPYEPKRAYPNEFIDIGDWLGTFNKASWKIKYREFYEARSYLRSLNFKSLGEWYEFRKTNKKPKDIPINLDNQYSKYKSWKGQSDFLNTGNIAPQKMKFVSLRKFMIFLKNNNISSGNKYREWRKNNQKPSDIPANPFKTYNNFQGYPKD
jgi:predicted helicase